MADINIDQLIGFGATGKIYSVTNPISNKRHAVKVINKNKLKQIDLDSIKREISIVMELEHPHIIKTYSTTETPNLIKIEMELFSGDLSKYIEKTGLLNSKDACIIFRQLVSAIDYLHNVKHIVHGDIKLQNVLFNNDIDMNVVLADFGYAYQHDKYTPSTYVVRGTPLYLAPEIRNHVKHDGYPADIYALGIFLYILTIDPDMGSVEEFRKSGLSLKQYLVLLEKRRFDNIKKMEDPLLADLLNRMLDIDYRQRINIKEIIEHPFFEICR